MNNKSPVSILIMSMLGLVALASAPAHATITSYLVSGKTCDGATSDRVSAIGQSIFVSVCVNTTTEMLCGHTIKFDQGDAADVKKFSVKSRTLGPLFSDPTLPDIVFPIDVPSPNDGMDFGGTRDNPAPAGQKQLLATFEITARGKSVRPAYLLNTNYQSIVSVSRDGTCFKTAEVPLRATFTINQN